MELGDEIPVRNSDRCGKGRWRWWLALAVVVAVAIVLSGFGFSAVAGTEPPPPPAVFLCRTVQGSWVGAGTSVAAFRGVPYGVAGRWQLPQPAPCWAKVLDASVPGPVCPQLARPKAPLVESEDCLNMNIYTPNLRSAKKPIPILVFVHGGSNVVGSNGAYANLESLVQSKQVCVFAPNYRLGVFGFMALQELSREDSRNSSGNYAIEDLRLALRWLKESANTFGCDPNSVTLLGHSSGATNIFALLMNPENTGLFHAVIALSGSANITQSLEQSERQGREVIANAKCEGVDPVACLRALPWLSVQNAMPPSWASTDFWPTDPNGIPNPGLPCVDGVTARTDLVSALAQSLVDVPILLQSARADLILFPRRDFVTMDFNRFESLLTTTFRPWPNTSTAKLLAEAYRSSSSVSGLRAWAELITDVTMYCAHLDLARVALSPRTRTTPVYVSVIDQPPSNPVYFAVPDSCPPELKGDPTCTSIPYVVKEPFHTWDYMVATRAWAQIVTRSSPTTYIPSSLDEKLGDLFRAQWIDFAVTKGVSTSQKAFDAPGTGFPTNFAVNLQGDANFSGLTRVVPNYRSPYCQLLKDTQLNPDSRFWLVN